ncbi:hypothetical protein ACFLXO_01845 [Chloroflexota bacterium]
MMVSPSITWTTRAVSDGELQPTRVRMREKVTVRSQTPLAIPHHPL